MRRSKSFFISFTLLSAFLILSCSSEKPDSMATATSEDFRKIAEDFQSKLSGVLSKEIANSGLVPAVKVCSYTAQALTSDFGTERGVLIKRVSFKNRNVMNKPDEFESRVLNKFEKLNSSGALNAETDHFEIIERNGKKTALYMKPIIMQPVCLNCHGSVKDIKDEVLNEIKSRYKSDLAVNFKVGELRGAISIRKRMN